MPRKILSGNTKIIIPKTWFHIIIRIEYKSLRAQIKARAPSFNCAKERLQSLTFAISMIYRQPAPPKNEQVKFKFQKLIKEENVSVYI
jgi:hypothetical protein